MKCIFSQDFVNSDFIYQVSFRGICYIFYRRTLSESCRRFEKKKYFRTFSSPFYRTFSFIFTYLLAMKHVALSVYFIFHGKSIHCWTFYYIFFYRIDSNIAHQDLFKSKVIKLHSNALQKLKNCTAKQRHIHGLLFIRAVYWLRMWIL